MPKTIFNEHIYPEESAEPYYNEISSFFNQQDVCAYNNKLRSYMILAGGGTVVFDANTSTLSWTEDFVIKNCISGYIVKFRYGPNNSSRIASIYDGQILYGFFPSAMNQNQERNLLVADKLDKTDNYVVLGFRHGDKLYLQNGMIL